MSDDTVETAEPRDLTAEEIFQCQDTAERMPLDVPQWKGRIYLRLITAGERDAFERQIFEDGEKGRPRNVRGRFAAMICVNKNGNRLFARPFDHKVLAEKNGAALDLIYEQGMKFNGWREEDKQALEKNSEATDDDS